MKTRVLRFSTDVVVPAEQSDQISMRATAERILKGEIQMFGPDFIVRNMEMEEMPDPEIKEP